MLKKINRVLKLLGLNLVRAKSPRHKAPKSEAQRVKETIAEFLNDPRPPYTREELEKCPPNPAWQSTPCSGVSASGKTHYVGDGCWPPHQEFESPKAKS